MHAYIYKTTDGGASWKLITTGLPNEPINTVREDGIKKGLLFAGSENAIYTSLDGGNNWQSLQLNMPATSIRDLVIKNDDIVVGTHGRSFWILDNITPLRQINNITSKETVLFKPQPAIRVRWNMNTDTPLPPEEPAGQNPPDGAVIDYHLSANSTGPIVLSITDAKGNLIRTFSSNDTMYTIPAVNIPLYWIRPQSVLSASAGAHRFLWDLKYTPINIPVSYPMTAVKNNTAPEATAPWVMPGSYTITLQANGKTYTQPIEIKIDPRVKTSVQDLQKQHDLSMICYEGRKKTINKNPALYRKFTALFEILEQTEMAPTTQVINAVLAAQKELN
jgi:hypothetical protein